MATAQEQVIQIIQNTCSVSPEVAVETESLIAPIYQAVAIRSMEMTLEVMDAEVKEISGRN